MSQGCPVVVSEKSALKEINGEAAEYFNPDNPNDIVNKFSKVLNTEKTKNKLRQIAKSHIKSFSWDKTVNKTLQILSS